MSTVTPDQKLGVGIMQRGLPTMNYGGETITISLNDAVTAFVPGSDLVGYPPGSLTGSPQSIVKILSGFLYANKLQIMQSRNLPSFNQHPRVAYAKRISDGVVVTIKRVVADSEEVTISRMLSNPQRLKDVHNHTVPILDYFIDENDTQQAFMVMPLLRLFNDPPFSSVDEVVDCVRQLLEVGLSL